MAHDDRPAAASGTFLLGGDLPVHRLGFGAMRITGPGHLGHPADRDGGEGALRRAVELERPIHRHGRLLRPRGERALIAEALHPYPDDLVIATKGGLMRPGPDRWVPNGRPDYLPGARGACGGCTSSSLDLYQFHRPDPEVPIAESIGALMALQDEGKIRHLAICNVNGTSWARRGRCVPTVWVQNRYNLADRHSESLVDGASAGLAFMPWAPIRT